MGKLNESGWHEVRTAWGKEGLEVDDVVVSKVISSRVNPTPYSTDWFVDIGVWSHHQAQSGRCIFAKAMPSEMWVFFINMMMILVTNEALSPTRK